MKNENFVIIPNIFLTENPQKLTPDELRIYYLIVQNELKWFKNLTKITINQLASEVNLRKNKHQNNNVIKQVLVELKNKEAIDFEDIEIANYSPLIISFKNIDFYKSLNGFRRGFEIIPFPVFNIARNSEEFYALCLIMKSKDGEIAYSTFASLLGVSEKSAKTLIQNMLDAKLINKESGRYYRNAENQVRQEINKYEILEQVETEEHNVVELYPNRDSSFTVERESESKADFHQQIEWGNWGKKNGKKYVNLTGEDLFLYHSQKDMDEEFKNQCEKQINSLKKAGFDFSKLDRYAKEKLHRLKNQKIEIEKKIEEAKNHTQIMKQVKEKQRRTNNKKVQEDNGFDVAKWDDAG